MLKTGFIRRILSVLMLGLSSIASAQNDTRPIVGVMKFSSDVESRYSGPITEKVVEMLTKSRRFQVVDRTSINNVESELKFQRTEHFIDSKHTSQQGVMVGADYVVTGHIRQINVSRILNADESVGGFKASLSFTIKIVETSTGFSNEAQSFESRGANKCLSPERAVDDAIRTLEPQLEEYFMNNFPVIVKVLRILSSKKEVADEILIAGGKSHGLSEGSRLNLQRIEMIEGKPYPVDFGEIKVVKLAGESFAECNIIRGGNELLKRYNAAEYIQCRLIHK